MKYGKNMEVMVIQVIKNDVINKIEEFNPDKLSYDFIKDLSKLIQDNSYHTEILSGLFDKCFPSWLDIFCVQIKHIHESRVFQDNLIPDNPYHDEVLKILSLSIDFPHNI